jgi:hypothetical protein
MKFFGSEKSRFVAGSLGGGIATTLSGASEAVGRGLAGMAKGVGALRRSFN